MSLGGSHEDDRLAEQGWPHLQHQNGVDAAELDVDLEAVVGEHLRHGASHFFRLDALGGDAEDAFSHPLDLSIHRSLPRQHHYHELQLQELFAEVVEHWLDIAGVVKQGSRKIFIPRSLEI